MAHVLLHRRIVWRHGGPRIRFALPGPDCEIGVRDSKIIMYPRRSMVGRRCPQTTFLSVGAAGAALQPWPSLPWLASRPSDTWCSPVLQPDGQRSMSWYG